MKYIFIISFLFLSTLILNAQRFGLGVEVGTTLAQMDGDFKVGFDKIGLQGGLRAIINFDKKEKYNLQIGLLYAQRGTRIEPYFQQANPTKTNIVHLEYAEIPFLVHINFISPETGFFLEFGASYNRLVGFDIEEELGFLSVNSFEEASKRFIKDELHGIATLGGHFNSTLALLIRYNLALTPLYEDPTIEAFQQIQFVNNRAFSSLRNYELSLSLVYTFESKKQRQKRQRKKKK